MYLSSKFFNSYSLGDKIAMCKMSGNLHNIFMISLIQNNVSTGNIFHSDHVSSPFHPALNYFTNYTSFSSNFFSQVFHSPSLHSLYSGYSSDQVVLASVWSTVRTELTSPSRMRLLPLHRNPVVGLLGGKFNDVLVEITWVDDSVGEAGDCREWVLAAASRACCSRRRALSFSSSCLDLLLWKRIT